MAKWEPVCSDDQAEYWHGVTQRLPVPGGWLYRSVIQNNQEVAAVAMAFVPGRQEE